MPVDLEALKQRAQQNRKRRRDRIRYATKARQGELIANRSKMVDYFDRLPLKQLTAVYKAAKQQFG